MSPKSHLLFILLHKQKIFSSFFRGWPSCALQLRTFLQTNQRKKVLNCSSWPHLLTAWCPCDNRQTGADSDKLNITRQTEKLVLDLVVQLQVPFTEWFPVFGVWPLKARGCQLVTPGTQIYLKVGCNQCDQRYFFWFWMS